MADFDKPDNNTLKVDVLTEIQDRATDVGTMARPTSNIPTNYVSWNSGTSNFEKWNGAAWVELSGSYNFDVTPSLLLSAINTVDGSGSGLDADLLDGQEGAYYLPAGSYTAADVLAKILTVDGSGSGLDADTIDGIESEFLVQQDSATGAATIPSGTDAQRPGSPATGMVRHSSTQTQFEGYDGTNWGSLGSDALPSRNAVMNQEAISQGQSTRTGMSSTIYTGNGTSQSINTGIDMSTGDFGGLVWIKNRDAAQSHLLTDSVRGITKQLRSNATDADGTSAVGITSLDATGFSIGAQIGINDNANDFISWSFQTNQKTSSVTNRNKAYTCHYNADMGFSIVGYEGDGVVGHEIPHHLGVEPELSIYKDRDSANSWYVSGSVIGAPDQVVFLDLTDAVVTDSSAALAPATAETVPLGVTALTNASTNNLISYHFSSKPGVSKVGKYLGTGQSGNYVDCGFKAGWVMVKNLTNATGWEIYDGIRPDGSFLHADSSAAEVAGTSRIELVDSGFVLENLYAENNSLNNEYLFLAFAETSSDSTKTWIDYSYATTQDTLTIEQNSLISFAQGFNAFGQVDTQEQVGAGITHTFGAGHENKKYWFYKDLAGAYGVSEYRPLVGITRNEADKWGVESPLDVTLRTTARHFDYENTTGIVLASTEAGSSVAYNAFDKVVNDIATASSLWRSTSPTTSWLQYKGTEKRILKSWRFREYSVTTTTPRRFTIEGSNDGFNWTAIDSTYTASDYTGNGANLWGDLHPTSGNTTAYLYHRINITANNGDGGNTDIHEMEFNTILPSDYYLVTDGKMYNSSDAIIERVYLAEIQTNSDGEISWFKNLPIAQIKGNSAEFQGNVVIHGDISNRGISTAWVSFDGSQNPPLIRDSHNIVDIVDSGTGNFYLIFKEPMSNVGYVVSGTAQGGATVVKLEAGSISKNSVQVTSRNSSGVLIDGFVHVSIMGGREIK